MDFKSLNIIKEIYETQNITRAAENLYISQPTITYHMQKIEKNLGFEILQRNPKGVTFTEEGKLVALFAQKTLLEWHNLYQTISKTDRSYSKTIRLGISSVVSKLKFPLLLKTYKEIHPHLKLNIHTGSSTLELPQLLKRNDIDIAIIRGDFTGDIPQEILKEEPYYLVSQKPIARQNLPNIPWIRYTASKITKSESKLNDWWHNYFKFNHDQIIQLDSIEATIQMVKYSLGWCNIPEIHLSQAEGLYREPIQTLKGEFITRKTNLVYQENILKNPDAMEFITYIRNNYK